MVDTVVITPRSGQRGHVWRDRDFFGLAATVLSLAMLLGGGTQIGLVSDAVVELVSLPLLLMAVLRLMETHWPAAWRWPVLIIAGALALPLLQIIPLPPSIWMALPGREFAAATYQAAGMDPPWLSLSLAPHATVYAFFAMLPGVALFLAALQMDTSRRVALLTLPLVLGAAGVLLGLAQVASRNAQDLSLYGAANVGNAIGFFSNRNHFGAMLYSLLPLAVAATTIRAGAAARRSGGPWLAILCGCVVVALLVGLSVAYSRAGVALGVVASLGSALIVWRSLGKRDIGRWPLILAGIALLVFAVLLQLGLVELLIRRSLIDVARQSIYGLTLVALRGYYAIGSGFGTFVPVFKTVESPGDISWYYVNHAHNDWLEIFLEGGILAALLLVAFAVWFVGRLFFVAFSRGAFANDPSGLLLARAGGLGAMLLLAHSAIDYPLRTLALMGVFAVSCAFLVPGPATPDSGGRERSRRSS